MFVKFHTETPRRCGKYKCEVLKVNKDYVDEKFQWQPLEPATFQFVPQHLNHCATPRA